jgi:ADP-ribose pyrophosphatase YjhB (NUDIX family)
MNDLTGFRFCPFCGRETLLDFEVKAIKCQNCGRVYYHNVASAVAAIVETELGIVLVRRSHAPHAGCLDLPGGFLDYAETHEAALRREVLEETGLHIKDLRYFCSFPNQYSYRNVTYFTADVVFLCTPERMDVLYGDHEVSEILIVPLDQIDPALIAIPSMRMAVELYLSQRESPEKTG